MTYIDLLIIGGLDGIATGLLYFVAAAGLSLILGTLRVLTLAHGLAYLAGTWLVWHTGGDTMGGLLFALLLAIPAGALLGVVGAAATWPLMRFGHTAQALATLGIALIGGQIFEAATGGAWLPAQAPPALDTVVHIGTATYPGYRLWFIAFAAAAGLLLAWIVHRTRVGALARATATEPQMVASLGINPLVVHIGVFAAGTAVAVAAGVMAAPVLPGGPETGEHILVMSLIIVALGGAGNLGGAALAAVCTGMISSLGPNIAPQAAPFALLGVLIVVLAFRPLGLAGRTA
ncbi:MAG TPA: hypothetical protein DGT23_09765 [Micromonosporaceae bacterium]|nr:hypothetical protein [Micromonosporaceae bacterium]